MGAHLRDFNTGDDLGVLATYSVTRDATPLNPVDGSTQVPSFSAVVRKGDVNAEATINSDVVLSTTTGFEMQGEVVNYSSNDDSGMFTLDVATIFDKLNTEQRVLPMQGFHDELLKYWFRECGVFDYTTFGDVQHYITDEPLGFVKNQVARLYNNVLYRRVGSNQYYEWFPTTGKTLEPLAITYSKSLLFSTTKMSDYDKREPYRTEWEFQGSDGTENKTYLSVELLNNVWYLKEKQGTKAVHTICSLPNVFPENPNYEQDYVFVLAELDTVDPTKVNFTLQVSTYHGWSAKATGQYASNVAREFGISCVRRIEPEATASGGWYYAYASYVNQMPTDRPKVRIDNKVSQLSQEGAGGGGLISLGQGFSGNVWAHIKEFCAVHGYDILIVDDVVTLQNMTPADSRPGDKLTVYNIKKEGTSKQIDNREKSRFVDVEISEFKLGGVNSGTLLWKADTVYSLEQGETKVELIQTDATFITLTNPVPVDGITFPYNSNTGSYVVTGNDGYIISPQWWRDNGGSITVKPTEKSGEIEVTMQAPNLTSTRAPYRISEGAADRPALYIVGDGVKPERRMIRISTGNSDAAQEVTEFKNNVVLMESEAYRIGSWLSNYYGGNSAEISFNTPNTGIAVSEWSSEKSNTLGDNPEGKLVYHDGSVYRILQTRISPATTEIGKAEQFDPVYLFDIEHSDMTVDEWDAAHENDLVKTVDLAPMKKYLG